MKEELKKLNIKTAEDVIKQYDEKINAKVEKEKAKHTGHTEAEIRNAISEAIFRAFNFEEKKEATLIKRFLEGHRPTIEAYRLKNKEDAINFSKIKKERNLKVFLEDFFNPKLPSYKENELYLQLNF